MSEHESRHPLFVPVIAVGGLLFGFGLAYSEMARPEVVIDFLQLQDLGLLFVMVSAVVAAFFLGMTAIACRPRTWKANGELRLTDVDVWGDAE